MARDNVDMKVAELVIGEDHLLIEYRGGEWFFDGFVASLESVTASIRKSLDKKDGIKTQLRFDWGGGPESDLLRRSVSIFDERYPRSKNS